MSKIFYDEIQEILLFGWKNIILRISKTRNKSISLLKGLSHEMDLAFHDMCTVVSFRPKTEDGTIKKNFFRCSNDFLIILYFKKCISRG